MMDHWPADLPLVCLVSGGQRGPRSRWSIFSTPTRVVRVPTGGSPQDAMDALATPPHFAPNVGAYADPRTLDIPFHGGWVGFLSYDLGASLEPAARSRPGEASAQPDSDFPMGELVWCPGAYVHDRASGAWWVTGEAAGLPALEELGEPGTSEPRISPMRVVRRPTSLWGRDGFEAAVARAVELVRAGDAFQVNLAHHLRASVKGEARDVARRLIGAAGPRYGAYLESLDELGGLRYAVASASPELFLEFDPRTRRLETRPIKGTRPAAGCAARRDLRASAKDRAELTMIVDLMRNDLGRLCAYGSVRVDEARGIERHGPGDGACDSADGSDGVYHTVATVSGEMRAGLTLADALRACFPAGSVTGAPKVRAMQIIDALEPRSRGVYCGSVGFASRCGRWGWNVAIRTATLTPGARAGELDVTYPVGAGIVADSVPASEWEETLHKAGSLRAALADEAHSAAVPGLTGAAPGANP